MLSLERACIRGVTERLPSLVQPTDYYLPLFFHVGTSGTAKSSLGSVKGGYRALGPTVKYSGVR